MANAASSKKNTIFISKLDSNLREKVVKCYNWSIVLCGAETCTLGEILQIYLETL
jgi:hypothetical protein